MSDGPRQHPSGHAGLFGLAGIVVFALSFPVFFVSTYWLDWAGIIVFVMMLVVAFGLVRLGLRRSR